MTDVALANTDKASLVDRLSSALPTGAIVRNRRASERSDFNAAIAVAPMLDRLPRRDEFQLAFCSDVSTGGISFYSTRLAASRPVVVWMTGTRELFIRSRVLSVVATRGPGGEDRSGFTFLVRCQFLERLRPEKFI